MDNRGPLPDLEGAFEDMALFAEPFQPQPHQPAAYGPPQPYYSDSHEPSAPGFDAQQQHMSIEAQLEALEAYEQQDEVQRAADDFIAQLPEDVRTSIAHCRDLLAALEPQATPALQSLATIEAQALEDVCMRLLKRPTALELWAATQATAEAAEQDDDEEAKVWGV